MEFVNSFHSAKTSRESKCAKQQKKSITFERQTNNLNIVRDNSWTTSNCSATLYISQWQNWLQQLKKILFVMPTMYWWALYDTQTNKTTISLHSNKHLHCVTEPPYFLR